MSYSPYRAQHEQVLYEANPETVSTLKNVQDRVQAIGKQNMNKWVRVQTLDGHTYEGIIVQVDPGHIYLSVPVAQRGFFGPGAYVYNNAILPLVLYNLLVITLLYT
ncbi:hypothetical protein [Paenibacillus rigui]|uniref:Uncharacterized protein n=1 Tax=Paenibacillus rigui TaxID=554312 RepID=A0A229UGC6_9BACL|nr:hypothetical protein [Paenibacillus rigui]OXM82422.1 hypothetical protein CF651_31070 [Paenibacillus rigui]